MEPALLVLVMFLLLGGVQATISEDFSTLFDSLRNDALGVDKFQKYLDDKVRYEARPLSGDSLIKEISSILSGKFSAAREMTQNIRNYTEAEFENLGTRPEYFDCCHPPNYVKFTYNDQLNSDVNPDYFCYIGVGSRSGTAKHFGRDMLNLMKRNYAKNFEAKWQYVGTEDGVMHIYPAKENCIKDFDPRFRPWYVETVSQKPKDLVLVLDGSGSMSATHGGITYMQIAKEAARTVVNTLNPNDEVGIVAFSTHSTIPTTAGVPECVETNLTQATSKNKIFLKSMIDSISPNGATQYTEGLKKAFDILSSRLLNSKQTEERDAVILFLTDGANTDDYQTIMNEIHSRNSQLGNRVVIMTFGIGGELTKLTGILRDMSDQKGANETYGTIRKGIPTLLSDPGQLRSSMGRYYDYFVSSTMGMDMRLSVPYFDGFGLGMITSMCSPVVTSEGLRGVACVDLTLSELLGAASFFKPSELSYTFIVDDHGRLMTHPLLPKLYEYSNDPVFIDMLKLEREPEAKDIRQAMLIGRKGNRTYTSKRIISRGDSIHDGVNSKNVLSEYYWQNIEKTNYSVCLVVGKSDKRIRYKSFERATSFLYHRLDIVQPPKPCNHFRQLASKVHSSVKFTPQAFVRPSTYTDQRQNKDTIKKYTDIMLGKSSRVGVFKDGVVETVAITAVLEKIWLSSESTEVSKNYTLWKSIGTENGVFRLYPGAPLYKNYDHKVRPWYRKAITAGDRYILTAPYMDAGGSGILMSLAKTVYQGSQTAHTANDVVFGVMTIDFTMSRFYNLIAKMFPECASRISCFVMDDSGHLLYHNDLYELRDERSIDQFHVIDKEPGIARDLIDRKYMSNESCVDVTNIRKNKFWRIEVPAYKSSVIVNNKYELYPVHGSNIYFVKKIKAPSNSDCICTKKSPTEKVVKCENSVNRVCQCPCSADAPYNYCMNEFILKGDVSPVCAPDSPPPRDTAPLGHHVAKNLPVCFNYDCSYINFKRDCENIVGCNWCIKSKGGDILKKPVCAPLRKCPEKAHTDDGTSTITTVAATTTRAAAAGLNIGLIVGIPVAVVIITVLLALIIVYCCIRRKRTHKDGNRSALYGPENTPYDEISLSGTGRTNAAYMNENNPEGMISAHDVPVNSSSLPRVCLHAETKEIMTKDDALSPVYDDLSFNPESNPPVYTPYA